MSINESVRHKLNSISMEFDPEEDKLNNSATSEAIFLTRQNRSINIFEKDIL